MRAISSTAGRVHCSRNRPTSRSRCTTGSITSMAARGCCNAISASATWYSAPHKRTSSPASTSMAASWRKRSRYACQSPARAITMPSTRMRSMRRSGGQSRCSMVRMRSSSACTSSGGLTRRPCCTSKPSMR
jgi:hypothetical protein